MVLLMVSCFVIGCWSCFEVAVLCLVKSYLGRLIMLVFAFFFWFGLGCALWVLVWFVLGDAAGSGLLIWYLV